MGGQSLITFLLQDWSRRSRRRTCVSPNLFCISPLIFESQGVVDVFGAPRNSFPGAPRSSFTLLPLSLLKLRMSLDQNLDLALRPRSHYSKNAASASES